MKTFEKIILGVVLILIIINIVNYLLKLEAEYKHAQDKDYIYNIPLSEIVIPHPKNLYTYKCDERMRCESRANTFIVNMDGIDFIPPKEFVLKCIDNSTISNYCQKMINIGTYNSIVWPDQASVDYVTGEFNKNPEFSNTLTKRQIKSIKKSKEELLRSIQ